MSPVIWIPILNKMFLNMIENFELFCDALCIDDCAGRRPGKEQQDVLNTRSDY